MYLPEIFNGNSDDTTSGAEPFRQADVRRPWWKKLKYSDGLELVILARRKGVAWAPPALLVVSAVELQDIIDRFDPMLI
ncbi:g9309 [Coccomyxa viridis]|uniref:G9309 protein n=1 Tax=Coccomyxa viridis TaxID=1274662 RepID=A0ABP1G2M7_9CHLO